MAAVKLSEADVGALEEATRLFLSPLDHGEVDGWRGPVVRAVGKLLGADLTTFILPLPGDAISYSEGNHPLSPAFVRSYLEAADACESRFGLLDRQRRLGVFCRRQLYTPEVYRSSYYRDWIVPVRAYDAIGMGIDLEPGGARATFLMHHDRRTGPRFGLRGLALLRLLFPAFRTGVEVRAGMALHAGRLGTFIDRLLEPLVMVSARGRILHRNPPAGRLLSADPHEARILKQIEALARGLGPVLRPEGNGREAPPEAVRTVRTRMAEYRLSGFAPPLDLRAHDLVVIRIRRSEDRSGLSPNRDVDAPRLRERYGLTRQEVVVARLLAHRRTNREIAGALSISPHTARRHTENIRMKLRVSSRRDVAERILPGTAEVPGGREP